MIRPEVGAVVAMGPLPESASAAADMERLQDYQRRLESIPKPLSDEEAEVLAGLFGPDDCFGLAWTLIHLIETAPGWPFVERLPESDNQWIQLLCDRAARGE